MIIYFVTRDYITTHEDSKLQAFRDTLDLANLIKKLTYFMEINPTWIDLFWQTKSSFL